MTAKGVIKSELSFLVGNDAYAIRAYGETLAKLKIDVFQELGSELISIADRVDDRADRISKQLELL